MKEMFEQISTPVALKKELPIPTVGNHVIGGAIISKDIISVQNECEKFATEVLNLPIINKK